MTTYEHPVTLTSETGEEIWVRHDAAPDASSALRVYAEDIGLSDEDVECYSPVGAVLMRSVPRDDDPDWHELVREDDDLTATYWQFTT